MFNINIYKNNESILERLEEIKCKPEIKQLEKRNISPEKKKSKKVLWGCSARSWSKKNKTNIYKT